MPLVTIITPTYNRPEMFAECATAVLAQTFTDWTWCVIFNCESWPKGYAPADYWSDPRIVPLWFPVTGAERKDRYIPACIINWIYPKVVTPYIYFLADDDLIDPDGMAALVEDVSVLGQHPDADAVYGRCEVVDQVIIPPGSAWCPTGDCRSIGDSWYRIACWCYDAGDVGLGTGVSPHCRLDGGQVLHTADLWRRATASGWKLTDSLHDSATCDGILLNRLAQFARFHYVPQRIVTHRRHAGATHHRPQPGNKNVSSPGECDDTGRAV